MEFEFARSVESFRLDFVADTVIDATGQIIPLTRREFRILHLLMAHADQILSYQDILEMLWGYDDTPNARNLLTVYILRLRRKIEPDMRRPQHIINVRGQGYSFRH